MTTVVVSEVPVPVLGGVRPPVPVPGVTDSVGTTVELSVEPGEVEVGNGAVVMGGIGVSRVEVVLLAATLEVEWPPGVVEMEEVESLCVDV